MSYLKETLYRELELKIATNVEGISFDPHIFRHLDSSNRHQEEVICLFEMAYETHVGIKFPAGFRSPHGLIFNLRWDRRSPYSFIYENASYYLAHYGEILFPVEFLSNKPSLEHGSKQMGSRPVFPGLLNLLYLFALLLL